MKTLGSTTYSTTQSKLFTNYLTGIASDTIDSGKQRKVETGDMFQAARMRDESAVSLHAFSQDELTAKFQPLLQTNISLRGERREVAKLTMENAHLWSTAPALMSEQIKDEKLSVSFKESRLNEETLREKFKILKQECKQLHEEIQAHAVRLDAQQKEILSVRSELDGLQNTLKVAQVGIAAEQAAIHYIFPKCTTKLYRLRSLHALRMFLADPEGTAENTDLCGESAAENYRRLLSEEERLAIKSRFQWVKDSFPTLRDSIKDLKDYASAAHAPCGDFEELLRHFQDDEDTRTALLVCKSVTDHLATIKM